MSRSEHLLVTDRRPSRHQAELSLSLGLLSHLRLSGYALADAELSKTDWRAIAASERSRPSQCPPSKADIYRPFRTLGQAQARSIRPWEANTNRGHPHPH